MTSFAWRARSLSALSVFSALTLLAACGGGGGEQDDSARPAAAATAQGVYAGAMQAADGTLDLRMVVLENGEFWTLYGEQTSQRFLVTGFAQGPSRLSRDGFSSTDLRDFNAPAERLGLSASHDPATRSLRGSLSNATGQASFSAGPITDSPYVYDTPALLATVQGNWVLTTLQAERVVVDISATGALTAAGAWGCNFSGTVLPRSSGKNVFDVRVSFGPAPCALANQTATGIALAYPLADGTTQLIVAMHDAGRRAGTAAFGVR